MIRLGMNQEKSNLARLPARLARLVIRMSSPVHCWLKTSMLSIVGRLPSSPASCNNTSCVLTADEGARHS